MRTIKFAFEINWPLDRSNQLLTIERHQVMCKKSFAMIDWIMEKIDLVGNLNPKLIQSRKNLFSEIIWSKSISEFKASAQKLWREKMKMYQRKKLFRENSVFAFSGLGVKCDEQVI